MYGAYAFNSQWKNGKDMSSKKDGTRKSIPDSPMFPIVRNIFSETQTEVTRPVNVNDAYAVTLKKEHDKLFGNEPIYKCFDHDWNTVNIEHSKQVDRPHLTNNPTAIKTRQPQASSAQNPFGEPPMGWMPKDQLMSIVRQIDKAHRMKNTGSKDANI